VAVHLPFRTESKREKTVMEDVESLKKRIAQLEQELVIARDQKHELRIAETSSSSDSREASSDELSLSEYQRYGRQMILDGFGRSCASFNGRSPWETYPLALPGIYGSCLTSSDKAERRFCPRHWCWRAGMPSATISSSSWYW
jgi:hypothetical protein